MSDIVKELRLVADAGDIPPRGHPALATRAADEIERLTALLRKARPFVERFAKGAASTDKLLDDIDAAVSCVS